MPTLYFATTSLNFGNIFSSESISPESFYSKREFGFDYFVNIFPQTKDFIILFKNFPDFDLPNKTEEESFKIVLELFIDRGVLETNTPEVYCSDETIYLSLKSLKRVHFMSKDQQFKVLAKAENSRALKCLPKYQHLFDYKAFNEIPKHYYLIDKIEFQENTGQNVAIARDRFLNNLKGGIYGFLCGQIAKKSDKEIIFYKAIQQIKNEFALLKNNLAHQTTNRDNYKKNKNFKEYYNDNMSMPLFKKLLSLINYNEEFFKSNIEDFKNANYKLAYLKEEVGKTFKGIVDNNALEFAIHFAKFSPNIDGIFEQSAFNWYQDIYRDKPFVLYRIIEQSVDGYFYTYSTEKREEYSSNILNATFKLEKYVERTYSEKNKNIPPINVASFEFTGLENLLRINNNLSGLNLDSNFEIIINTILNNGKKKKGKVNDSELLPLIEIVGDKTYGIGKTSRLYRYFNKEILTYQESDSTSVVLKNFTAFVFNPNEIEKLQKYIEEKEILDPYYAYAFYGAYNGFASFSKDLTKIIFENKDLQNSLDIYFENAWLQISKINMEFVAEKVVESNTSQTYESIVAHLNSIKENSPNGHLQENRLIDLEKLTLDIISKLKKELGKKYNLNFESSIEKAITEIRKKADYTRISKEGQEHFVKSQLAKLLSTKFKTPGMGKATISKICEVIH